jgi:hypothetical protein
MQKTTRWLEWLHSTKCTTLVEDWKINCDDDNQLTSTSVSELTSEFTGVHVSLTDFPELINAVTAKECGTNVADQKASSPGLVTGLDLTLTHS